MGAQERGFSHTDRAPVVYESVLLIFYSMVISDLRHYHGTVLFVQYGPNFGTKSAGLGPKSDQNWVPGHLLVG